jgi:hypothetical protein
MSTAQANEIFQFPETTFVENILVLPNGHLLLSTFASGDLLMLDPTASTPVPQKVVTLGDATGLTGIAPLGNDLYAVSGGLYLNFKFGEGSMHLYVVSLDSETGQGTVVDSIPVPDTMMMNGLTALPRRPGTALSADSIRGRILRIDTVTKKVDVAIEDPELGLGSNPLVPLGVNGIRTRDAYLYFANSVLGTFGRIPIDDEGNKTGDVEIIARLEGETGMHNAYDDFTLDRQGNAYVTLHSAWVVKITSDGAQSRIAGEGITSQPFKDPTSAGLSNDGKSIYVSTGGGQVIQVGI